jgi:VWFA-related protein
MRSNRLVVAPLVTLLAFPPVLDVGAASQEAPAAPQAPAIPTFGVGTAAVTLDVVVRDKKGNAVRDLKASDFEVYEDGAKQLVESFQVFGRPLESAEAPVPRRAATPAAVPPAPALSAAPPAEDAPETRPQIIAFVFDRLSADARNTAHKAAMTYLDRGHVEGDVVGVFAIDLALRTIQPFTKEPSLIKVGLERAASQANTAFSGDRERTRQIVDVVSAGEATAAGGTGSSPSGPGAGSAGASISSAASAGALNQAIGRIQVGMLRTFEALERDQQGYASTNGLLSVVNGLKSLPGRKTVVFFSEGLAIPANVQAQFRSLIHSANRANVSVYAMDAGGLRAESMNAETRKEMMQAAQRRQRQIESGREDANDGIMSRTLERNEDLLRLHPESGLGTLANETGGFLIHDTNDAASAFRRMEEDMRFHYLLGYSPSNESYDGRFRSISVKVSRPGVQVQTRQGYYAIRAAESVPLRSFEAPALAQFDRQPRPHAFPLDAVALSFPTAKKPGLVPVLVRVPGPTVTYRLDKDDKSGKKIHRADLAVVARVKDHSGREVDRLSQHYALSAAEANLEAARRGDILFYREADLGPGRYTVEAVAYDAVADKASVSTASLEVAATAPGQPRLSSIVLVGRAEKASPSEQSDNPLFYGETIIYPNMGEPFRKSTSPNLGFFFTVYGVPPGTVSPRATIEVYRGDAPAGRVTADLPTPDASGRIQYAGALPLQSFPAGSYRLKVTALMGNASDSRQASFTVTE